MNFKFSTSVIMLLTSLCFTASASSMPFSDKTPTSFFSLSKIDESDIKTKILSEYAQWKGVKYKYGGNSIHGIDCSALMQKIYNSAFAEFLPNKLPRSTAQQIKHGTRTSKHELRAGDLIFFQMDKNERHVGVYLGDSQFIHASTSKGVMISKLTNHYWAKRYTTARRILA